MKYMVMKINKDNLERVTELTDIELNELKETYQATNPNDHAFYFILETRPDVWTTWRMLPEKVFHTSFVSLEQEQENMFTEATMPNVKGTI